MSKTPAPPAAHEGAYKPPRWDDGGLRDLVSIGGQTWRLSDFLALGGVRPADGKPHWGPSGPPVMASHEGPDTLNFGANASPEDAPA